MTRSTDLYACENERIGLADFYPSAFVCKVADPDAVVHKVRVTEAEPRDPKAKGYWAWWDLEKDEFMFVYPGRLLVAICFPYGPEIEEEHGKGLLLPVNVEVLERDVSTERK